MEQSDAKLLKELATRRQYIDPTLKERGWSRRNIIIEVNSIQSDFKSYNYVYFDGNTEDESRFIDYVLLDDDESILGIIEAKRYDSEVHKGRIQARTYAYDIKEQIDQDVPIFLTNGHEWRFIDEYGHEESVSGPFSPIDLKRRKYLYKNMEDPTKIRINSDIVDRSKSVEIVKKISEHISDGNRKALIQMATGTGKTRVAMAVIDLLIESKCIRNVLFIADRVSLVNQAKSQGFKAFFRYPIINLRDKFETSGTLYVSTIQTLMGRDENGIRLFEKFSPGFFDLIIFDEAHRSIYDRNNRVFNYFYAIKIGLTATPSNYEDRNTYNLFECTNRIPTVSYSYDEAIRDGVLVPFQPEIFKTRVLTSGISTEDLSEELKDELRRQEEDPENIELSGSQFGRFFMDNKTNELIIRQFMANCYKSDEGKPCKSIFFCINQAHADHMKEIFDKCFPNLGGNVQVITSKFDKCEDEVSRFQTHSEPRIAISVDMLETGIDVPEVCNLVFVRPIRSPIKFWQMLGRGTRNQESCKHPEWLPNREKHDFIIFDFAIGGYSNLKEHEFEVHNEKTIQEDVIVKIFKNKVNLLDEALTEEQRKIIALEIMNNIDSLDKNSYIIREKVPLINKIKRNQFKLEEFIEELRNEIAPLMITNPGSNPYVSSFVLNVENLFWFIYDLDYEKIEKVKKYVQHMADNILQKDNLNIIKENRDKISIVFREQFWGNITFNDVIFLVKDLAPLMKYYEPERKKLLQIDVTDEIISRETSIKNIGEDPEVIEFLNNNKIIRKIKEGKCFTPLDLHQLESELSSLNPQITIENIQDYHNKDFISFLNEIIDLGLDYDPKMLEKLFDEFIIDSSHYNSEQIKFLNLLKKVFAKRKYLELRDFGVAPLSNEDSSIFEDEELEFIIDECNKIIIC